MLLKPQYLATIPSETLSREECAHQETLIEEIVRIKKEKQAHIFCHNYQRSEVQHVADCVGDSYALAVAAKESDCQTIVFCGVRFMAETAHILNPEKTILLPEQDAGCPLADQISAHDIAGWRDQYPKSQVVMYINCNAETKAACDIVCTSSNALEIVQSLKSSTVLFGPDANLAEFVQASTKKNIVSWPGFCPVHKALTRDMLRQTLERFPDSMVLAHPECNPEIIDMCDMVLSSGQMLNVISKKPGKRFVVGTEIGLIQKARKLFPNKEIHPIYSDKDCSQTCVCPFMKMTTLESVLRSLQTETHVVVVPPAIRNQALKAVTEMLRYAPSLSLLRGD